MATAGKASGCPEVRCNVTEKMAGAPADCRAVENELTTREIELSAALRDLKKLRADFSDVQQVRSEWAAEVSKLKLGALLIG